MITRIGGLFALFGALWGLHVWDKELAVSAARDGYVLEFELSAARAERDALRAKVAVASEAARALQEKVQVAEGQSARFLKELEAYQNEIEANPSCVLGDDLWKLLQLD